MPTSLPQSPGIYTVTCTPTGKMYVGSAVNVYRRWHAHHLPALRRGRHVNVYLQRAWTLYGESAFVCTCVELVAEKLLLTQREQFWMNKQRSTDRAYGFNLVTIAGSTTGYRHTAATLERLRQKGQDYIVRDPSGREQFVHNLLQFCRRMSICREGLIRVACGKATNAHGWECRYASVTRAGWKRSWRIKPKLVTVVRGNRKRCSRCTRWRSVKTFTKDRTMKCGLSAYCQDCVQKKSRAYKRRKNAPMADLFFFEQ